MSDGNAEAAAEGENATQESIPPEPNHPHVPGEVNKEDKGEVAAEGEETAQKPTSSEPAHSLSGGEVKKEINAEAASGDNAEAAIARGRRRQLFQAHGIIGVSIHEPQRIGADAGV